MYQPKVSLVSLDVKGKNPGKVQTILDMTVDNNKQTRNSSETKLLIHTEELFTQHQDL